MCPYFVQPPFMISLVTYLLRESHQGEARPLLNSNQLSSCQRRWSLCARRRHAPLDSCCRRCTDTSANIRNSCRTACVPAAAVRLFNLTSPQQPKPSIPVGGKHPSGVRAASRGNVFDNGAQPHDDGGEKSRARVPRPSRAEPESLWRTLLDEVLSSEHCERGCSARQPRNKNGAACMADGYRQPFRLAPRLKSVCILWKDSNPTRDAKYGLRMWQDRACVHHMSSWTSGEMPRSVVEDSSGFESTRMR